MKTKRLKEFLSNIREESEYRIRMLCGKPTPMKRFIIVLVMAVSLSIFSLYSLVGSIYNIGKSDARKEFLKIEHIKKLELKNDSINLLKQKMYEEK